MCQKKPVNDVETDVIEELNNAGRWSVTLHDPTGRVVDRTYITKQEVTLNLSLIVARTVLF